jgi:pSer/pThr/pTyr-binding forkhead associated (FHA) protein
MYSFGFSVFDSAMHKNLISRYHCKFIKDDAAGSLRVIDNESINGILVNDIKVIDALLSYVAIADPCMMPFGVAGAHCDVY